MSHGDPILPDEARQTLADLLARCTSTNSTVAFRSAVEQAIGTLDRGELASAVSIIGETTSHVADAHDCARHLDVFPACVLKASEDETKAYDTLDMLRFGFGCLYMDRLGNNVMVLR